MNSELTRRQFLKKSSFISLGLISGLGVTSTVFANNKSMPEPDRLKSTDDSTISICTFDIDALRQ
jgi:anaerobic selenocysteine-containing dehydrogenase